MLAGDYWTVNVALGPSGHFAQLPETPPPRVAALALALSGPIFSRFHPILLRAASECVCVCEMRAAYNNCHRRKSRLTSCFSYLFMPSPGRLDSGRPASREQRKSACRRCLLALQTLLPSFLPGTFWRSTLVLYTWFYKLNCWKNIFHWLMLQWDATQIKIFKNSDAWQFKCRNEICCIFIRSRGLKIMLKAKY
jgi:hypothetical protein